MDTDTRDDALGRSLDRVASRIVVQPDLKHVLRRGGRRRAVRMSAIVAVLAIFVGGVAWAAVTLRDNPTIPATPPTSGEQVPRGWVTHFDPESNLSIQTPRWWSYRIDPLPSLKRPKIVFETGDYPLSGAETGSCAPISAIKALPADGMLMYVEYLRSPSGGDFPPFTQPQPIGPESAGPLECLGRKANVASFSLGAGHYQVFTLFGPEASLGLRHQAEQVLSSLALGQSASPSAGPLASVAPSGPCGAPTVQARVAGIPGMGGAVGQSPFWVFGLGVPGGPASVPLDLTHKYPRYKVVFVVDGRLATSISVTGTRSDGAPLRFQLAGARHWGTTLTFPERSTGTPTVPNANTHLKYYPAYVYAGTVGCYTMTASWPGGTESIPFAVAGDSASTTPPPGGLGQVTGRLAAVGGPAPGAPRPLPGSVRVVGSDGRTVASGTVGVDGRFFITVPPGQYSLVGTSPQYQGGKWLCRATRPITVPSGATVNADVLCQEK